MPYAEKCCFCIIVIIIFGDDLNLYIDIVVHVNTLTYCYLLYFVCVVHLTAFSLLIAYTVDI